MNTENTKVYGFFDDAGLIMRCHTWIPPRNKHRAIDFRRHKIAHVRVNPQTGNIYQVFWATLHITQHANPTLLPALITGPTGPPPPVIEWSDDAQDWFAADA